MPKGDLYKCAMCKGVFRKGRSDEEARAEFDQRHPANEEKDLICDECFVGFDRWMNSLTPEQRGFIERFGEIEPPLVHVTTRPLTEQDKKERRINMSISIWRGTEGSG